MFLLFSIFFACLLPTGGENQTAVAAVAKPDKSYIARSDAGQHLNFDFIPKNQSDEKLITTKSSFRFLTARGQTCAARIL